MEGNQETGDRLDDPDTTDDRLDDLDTTDEAAESVSGGGILQGDGG